MTKKLKKIFLNLKGKPGNELSKGGFEKLQCMPRCLEGHALIQENPKSLISHSWLTLKLCMAGNKDSDTPVGHLWNTEIMPNMLTEILGKG